jgi:hypothetical protein
MPPNYSSTVNEIWGVAEQRDPISAVVTGKNDLRDVAADTIHETHTKKARHGG